MAGQSLKTHRVTGRVELEIDCPGHAAALCVGYPELCATSGSALDPSKNATFEFLDSLMGELVDGPVDLAKGGGSHSTNTTSIFSEMFFHLGGDEVDTRPWGPPPGTNVNITGSYPAHSF